MFFLVRYCLFMTLLVTGPVVAAQVQTVDYWQQYNHCVKDNGPISNAVVDMCSSQVSAEAKAEMNRLYMRFYRSLENESPGDAVALEQTQKSWLAYREGQCALATRYVGSPMSSYCPMQLNIQRVEQLRELAGHQE